MTRCPPIRKHIWGERYVHCFSFQIRNPILYEVNGTSQYCESDSLKVSPVSEELVPLLERPIEFEYKEGKVGKIHCNDDELEYILNIKRGILSILHHNFTKPELSVDDKEPRMYKNWEVIYFSQYCLCESSNFKCKDAVCTSYNFLTILWRLLTVSFIYSIGVPMIF